MLIETFVALACPLAFTVVEEPACFSTEVTANYTAVTQSVVRAGQVISTRVRKNDRLSYSVEYKYNANGQVVGEDYTLPGRGKWSTFTQHDRQNRVTDRATYRFVDGVFAVESMQRFSYNALGRLRSITSTDALGVIVTESYLYNRLGQPTTVVDTRGRTRVFTYNAHDVLSAETHWGIRGLYYVVDYFYDNLGRIVLKAEEAYSRNGSYPINTIYSYACDAGAISIIRTTPGEFGDLHQIENVLFDVNNITHEIDLDGDGDIEKTTIKEFDGGRVVYEEYWRGDRLERSVDTQYECLVP